MPVDISCRHTKVTPCVSSTIAPTGETHTGVLSASWVLTCIHSLLPAAPVLAVTSTCHSISSAVNVFAGKSCQVCAPLMVTLLTSCCPCVRQRSTAEVWTISPGASSAPSAVTDQPKRLTWCFSTRLPSAGYRSAGATGSSLLLKVVQLLAVVPPLVSVTSTCQSISPAGSTPAGIV